MKQTFAVALVAILGTALSPAVWAESPFDGVYAGLHAGYVDGEDQGKDYWEGVFTDWTQKITPDSGLFGGFAGFNRVLDNNVLIGVEADYEYRGGSDKSLMEYEGVPDPGYEFKTQLKDAASLRARLGYVFNAGKTLGYVTAGYAAANIKRTLYDYYIPDSETRSNWHNGWTLGLGAEHFASEKLSFKAEYRYADYGRETINFAPMWDAMEEEKFRYDEQSVRLGLAYHF